MKVTCNSDLMFVLEVENENDQQFVDALHHPGCGIAYVEDFVPSPKDANDFYHYTGLVFNVDSDSPHALRDQAGRGLVYALGKLRGLVLGDATDNGVVKPSPTDPDF